MILVFISRGEEGMIVTTPLKTCTWRGNNIHKIGLHTLGFHGGSIHVTYLSYLVLLMFHLSFAKCVFVFVSWLFVDGTTLRGMGRVSYKTKFYSFSK
jgi:hypothetical protein